MSDYKNREYEIATVLKHGLTSPHVEIVQEGDVFYNVYLRTQFTGGADIRDFTRGWNETRTLAELVNYEDAQRIAEEEARASGVVLLLSEMNGEHSSKVLFHPEGWEPVIG